MGAIRWLTLTLVALAVALWTAACGPQHLSALGNPGDYCTESTACTDGSTCRETDDGFRCVGGPDESRRFEEEEEDEEGPSATVEAGNEEDDEEFDEGEEMDVEEESDSEDRYLPPSRRRRGRGRR